MTKGAATQPELPPLNDLRPWPTQVDAHTREPSPSQEAIRMWAVETAMTTLGTNKGLAFIHPDLVLQVLDRAAKLESFVAHGASGSAAASETTEGVTVPAQPKP